MTSRQFAYEAVPDQIMGLDHSAPMNYHQHAQSQANGSVQQMSARGQFQTFGHPNMSARTFVNSMAVAQSPGVVLSPAVRLRSVPAHAIAGPEGVVAHSLTGGRGSFQHVPHEVLEQELEENRLEMLPQAGRSRVPQLKEKLELVIDDAVRRIRGLPDELRDNEILTTTRAWAQDITNDPRVDQAVNGLNSAWKAFNEGMDVANKYMERLVNNLSRPK